MIWFTWVCYISYNKGEEGIGHYVIRVGTIPPMVGVYGILPPPSPVSPLLYDIMTGVKRGGQSLFASLHNKKRNMVLKIFLGKKLLNL